MGGNELPDVPKIEPAGQKYPSAHVFPNQSCRGRDNVCTKPVQERSIPTLRNQVCFCEQGYGVGQPGRDI